MQYPASNWKRSAGSALVVGALLGCASSEAVPRAASAEPAEAVESPTASIWYIDSTTSNLAVVELYQSGSASPW
jgi:hypothetical protein